MYTEMRDYIDTRVIVPLAMGRTCIDA